MIPDVTCTRIVEANGRELGRIWEVKGRGSFFTLTRRIAAGPAGGSKCTNYGINSRYLFAAERSHA